MSFTWHHGTARQPQWRRLTIDELLRLLPEDAEMVFRLAPPILVTDDALDAVDDDTWDGDE